MRLSKKLRGFTLIELLVAISVVALLLSVATVSYSEVQRKARNRKRQIDLHIFATALERYYADRGFYPITNMGTHVPAQMETAGRTSDDKINCLVGGQAALDVPSTLIDFSCTQDGENIPLRPIPPPYNVYLANGQTSQIPIDPIGEGGGLGKYYAYASNGQSYVLVTQCYEGTAPSAHLFTSSNSPYYNEATRWTGNQPTTNCAKSSLWSNQYFLGSPDR